MLVSFLWEKGEEDEGDYRGKRENGKDQENGKNEKEDKEKDREKEKNE